jgi:hypothetical protein
VNKIVKGNPILVGGRNDRTIVAADELVEEFVLRGGGLLLLLLVVVLALPVEAEASCCLPHMPHIFSGYDLQVLADSIPCCRPDPTRRCLSQTLGLLEGFFSGLLALRSGRQPCT